MSLGVLCESGSHKVLQVSQSVDVWQSSKLQTLQPNTWFNSGSFILLHPWSSVFLQPENGDDNAKQLISIISLDNDSGSLLIAQNLIFQVIRMRENALGMAFYPIANDILIEDLSNLIRELTG